MQVKIVNPSLSKKQRIDIFKMFCIESNLEFLSIEKYDKYFDLVKVRIGNELVNLFIIFKNVVNSGWAEKPEIKRIQVSSLRDNILPLRSKTDISMFVGISFANDEPIIAVWNPFSYVYHKTNRSCYVMVDSIARAYCDGLYKTFDSNKNVLLCNSKNLKRLIDLYLE